MAQPDAVGLEVADMLGHHQARRRPVEHELQPGETDDVQRTLRVTVLHAGRDQDILAVECVVGRANDILLDVPHAGVLRVEHLDRLLDDLVGGHASRAAVLEPRLGVEDRPTAAGQDLLAGSGSRTILRPSLEGNAGGRLAGQVRRVIGPSDRFGPDETWQQQATIHSAGQHGIKYLKRFLRFASAFIVLCLPPSICVSYVSDVLYILQDGCAINKLLVRQNKQPLRTPNLRGDSSAGRLEWGLPRRVGQEVGWDEYDESHH